MSPFGRVLLTYVCGIALCLALLVASGHCAIDTKHHDNSLGVLQYQINPFSYIGVNDIAEATNIEGNLNLRVKPIGTYMLFDQIVLLCGLPIERFQEVGRPFIMTYERQSHRMVEGIGCHELVRVDEIKLRKEIQ
jgi:hypothetical protein